MSPKPSEKSARKRPAPRPGRPARGTRTGRPVMVLLDLLGRRGSLRVLWELRAGTPLTFRALQSAAQTNPSVLNTRLQELREVGIVVHDGEGYVLSPLGRDLLARLAPLREWAQAWARQLGTSTQGT